uniref:tyrosine-type recombinase/integrase n=1 Tax=Klebsiella quasipneumoniae TaxID=1463165 RepID=UPI00398559D1
NRLIRCVCGKKIGPDPRNFNQRVSFGRNDLLIRTFPNQHISPRQYNRIFHGWVAKIGLEDSLYSTHSMRRTKPYLIYKKTKNLRVIQLLLGHKKLESTVRYLGIEVDDALEISESIEV